MRERNGLRDTGRAAREEDDADVVVRDLQVRRRLAISRQDLFSERLEPGGFADTPCRVSICDRDISTPGRARHHLDLVRGRARTHRSGRGADARAREDRRRRQDTGRRNERDAITRHDAYCNECRRDVVDRFA